MFGGSAAKAPDSPALQVQGGLQDRAQLCVWILPWGLSIFTIWSLALCKVCDPRESLKLQCLLNELVSEITHSHFYNTVSIRRESLSKGPIQGEREYKWSSKSYPRTVNMF